MPFICDYNAYEANGDTLIDSKDGPVLIPYDEDRGCRRNGALLNGEIINAIFHADSDELLFISIVLKSL